jgi:hypothetical protein
MVASSFTSRRSSPVVRKTRSFATRIALLLVLLSVPATAARAQGSDGFVVTGVNLGRFEVVDNVLTAQGTVTGTLAGLTFTTPITKFALEQVVDDSSTAQTECSVLHLELAPIHLALLGLHVDTSAICLDLTATQGGGLLGDLLCGLAGGPLGLGGSPLLPSLGQIAELQTGLISLLNGSLGQTLSPASATAAQDSVCTGDCEILELVLGPLNLTLLGLNVSLDDCNGGPVQVCISASRGEGLLGNLLCGLSGADVLNLTLADIATLLRRATALLADGQLSRRDAGELTALLGRLIRS